MPTINENLGAYSDLFMLLAAMAYAIAFISFAWDLAKSSRTIRELESGLLADEARQLAMAGAATTGTDRGSAATHSPSGPHAPAEDDGLLVNESMNYTRDAGKRTAARIGVSVAWIGWLIHGFAVVSRAIAAGRVPWGNMYEFLTTGAFVVATVFLVVLLRKDLRFMGTFVIGLVTLMLCAATMGFPTPVAHLVPALQSPWLIIHVSIAVLASSLFTITFALSVLQLLQADRQSKLAAGKPDKLAFLRMVPSAAALENFAYRINTIGFVMWTFTLMAGAVWAEAAWGRYWGWDTKEVWTFVIWVVFAGYLHARATRGWTGTRSAWLSIIGYLCVVFNFTVVNLYFNGLHSYAGV
ncbi:MULTISPECIES: c-type cytochrome biogenesis protein CcsB [Micrococcaceae]|uniref:Cytochrome c-type biogenesis protein CcsA/ResC n=1 Tax=Arthrobacter rhombi TaxID=71253 RepID=A0A1R4G5I0_9MICC|nr:MULTISPECIES: c-type cytochrome biogenesis protein CcsB [Micrococcaceae]PCC26017.1 c-type cytochrome biogenesis protein CcsB [Glutamicibacter sp. BW78]SJM63406.1 Cytochrome c-type biogenesis protein CcsA/ResC [Arthrobacter rhombi]